VAQFDANIKLVAEDKTAAAVKQAESRIEALQKKAASIAIGGAKSFATKNLNEYTATVGKLDKALGGLGARLVNVAKAFDFGGKTVVGVAGINALANGLQSLPKFLGGAEGAIGQFAGAVANLTSPINAVVNGLQAIGPSGLAAGAGLAAATAAVMAFGPPIQKAVKNVNELNSKLKEGFTNFKNPISESTLTKALKEAQSEQKKLSAGTSEYTRKTEEVVAIQRELTGELRRQELVLKRVNAQ